MKIIFYKYRNLFGYGAEDWQEEFKIVNDEYSVKEHIQIIKDDLERQYNYNEHFRGIDFKIIKPNKKMIQKQINKNKQHILNIDNEIEFLTKELQKNK